MQVLWELRGFPAASLAGNNQKSAAFNRLNQPGFVLIDRQLFGLVFGVPSRWFGHNRQLFIDKYQFKELDRN